MWDNCSFNLNLDVHLCNEMDSNGQLNTNGIDSQAVMSDQTQYSPGLSVPTSNLELSKQNDAKENYGLDGDDQLLDDDIEDNAARMDGDEPEVKKEFDDTNNQLITENQVSQSSSSLHAPFSNEQLNQNLINCKDEDDCDCDDCRNGIEIKEENEEDDNDDDNYQTIEDYDEEYDLDGGSRNDEQLNGLEYGDIGDDARMDGDEVEVKEEIDDTNNQLTNELPQNPPSLPAPASNDELSNQNDPDYGLESTLDGDDDQQQNEHLIYGNDVTNEHNEELSRHRKKLRLETTQPTTNVNSRQSRVTGQSLKLSNRNQTDQEQNMNQQTNLDERQQTEETDEASEGNNQDKQIIDISLQCLETDCPLMFNNKTELNQHMSTQHGILSHKCVVKDCNQSFSNKYKLGRHIAQVHSNTTQWCCDKCPKHLNTYKILSKHNYRMHQLGQYQCAFSNCAFIAENRQEVANHYSLQHKTIEFTCRHSNCGRRFNDRSNFKRHQRAHLGIKPYRCKWPNCGYAATKDGNTIRHIKRNHFTPNSQATEQHLDNPKEYLEVLHDLL